MAFKKLFFQILMLKNLYFIVKPVPENKERKILKSMLLK